MITSFLKLSVIAGSLVIAGYSNAANPHEIRFDIDRSGNIVAPQDEDYGSEPGTQSISATTSNNATTSDCTYYGQLTFAQISLPEDILEQVVDLADHTYHGAMFSWSDWGEDCDPNVTAHIKYKIFQKLDDLDNDMAYPDKSVSHLYQNSNLTKGQIYSRRLRYDTCYFHFPQPREGNKDVRYYVHAQFTLSNGVQLHVNSPIKPVHCLILPHTEVNLNPYRIYPIPPN